MTDQEIIDQLARRWCTHVYGGCAGVLSIEPLSPSRGVLRLEEDEPNLDLVIGTWPDYPPGEPDQAWHATVREPDTGTEIWIEFVRFGDLVYSADSCSIQYFAPLVWEW